MHCVASHRVVAYKRQELDFHKTTKLYNELIGSVFLQPQQLQKSDIVMESYAKALGSSSPEAVLSLHSYAGTATKKVLSEEGLETESLCEAVSDVPPPKSCGKAKNEAAVGPSKMGSQMDLNEQPSIHQSSESNSLSDLYGESEKMCISSENVRITNIDKESFVSARDFTRGAAMKRNIEENIAMKQAESSDSSRQKMAIN
ncbi:hypothetical protein Anapl_11475 [Anas platyrhynchos]|uniref:Uncharacterized protein n=1 Tax=Anas platyrhynchos TaxID=8839 RepID=R0K852_ANAPL|nr:hypothetical protein Anapl_11475 [Anas platyrhynchos]